MSNIDLFCNPNKGQCEGLPSKEECVTVLKEVKNNYRPRSYAITVVYKRIQNYQISKLFCVPLCTDLMYRFCNVSSSFRWNQCQYKIASARLFFCTYWCYRIDSNTTICPLYGQGLGQVVHGSSCCTSVTEVRQNTNLLWFTTNWLTQSSKS